MQFFHKLSLRERSIIVSGVVVIVLFLVYFFVIAGQLQKISSLKNKIEKVEANRDTIAEYIKSYKGLEQERNVLRDKLKERDQKMDLNREVSKIETALKFANKTLTPGRESHKHDVYTVSRANIRYVNKNLQDIVKYLYEIEKPERGIIVKNFTLEPQPKKRDQFNLSINIYTVSLVDSGQ